MVGTSLTTGQTNTTVWAGIHHKSTMYGGPFGYPDPSYFSRVLEELQVRNIDFDSIVDMDHVVPEGGSRTIKNGKVDTASNRDGALPPEPAPVFNTWAINHAAPRPAPRKNQVTIECDNQEALTKIIDILKSNITDLDFNLVHNRHTKKIRIRGDGKKKEAVPKQEDDEEEDDDPLNGLFGDDEDDY